MSAPAEQQPQPSWAVALDRMRTRDGGQLDHEVTLTSSEAYAFVRHYLEQAQLLEMTEAALRERNSRLGLMERLAQGKPVTYPAVGTL